MPIITQKGIGGPGNTNYTANAVKSGSATTVSTASSSAKKKFSTSVVSNIDNLLKLQEDETKYTADAKAATTTATGYKKEVDAYDAATKSSEADADIARVSGDILAYQDYRKYLTTAGQQKAAIAGHGFKQSGSALYLAQSSLQQGLLTQQLDVTNAQEKQIGYLETAAANKAQGAAAQVASDAATSLATTDTATATTSKTNADALSKSLTDYLGTVDPTSVTPEDKLTLATLSTNPDTALSSTVNDLTTKAKDNKTTIDEAAAGTTTTPTTGAGSTYGTVGGTLKAGSILTR